MGKRYEKQKRAVGEYRKNLERIDSEKKALAAEYAPFGELLGLDSLIDDEAAWAIQEAVTIYEAEQKRLDVETEGLSKEKEVLEETIDAEVDKLRVGQKKLEMADSVPFGRSEVAQARAEYKKQIAKFQDLLDALDVEDDCGQLPENQRYVQNTLLALSDGLPETFDRETVLAGSQGRALNSPSTTSGGVVKGEWRDEVFFLDDDFVPPAYNPDRMTVAEIKADLKNRFNIVFDGIPYKNGIADFSSVSVAQIDTADIVSMASGMSPEEYNTLSQRERVKLLQDVFSSVMDGKDKRERNFGLADRIAAERHFPIPGLPEGYSAEQLREWRTKNHFSWDEQVHGGYNLVPTIIHGNLSHTGLVSVAGQAHSYISQRGLELLEYPERFAWPERDAPVSLSELFPPAEQ